jgi:hypothetical protein
MEPEDVLACPSCTFLNPAHVGLCQVCGSRVPTRAELEKAAREGRSVTDRIDDAAARLATVRAQVPCRALLPRCHTAA